MTAIDELIALRKDACIIYQIDGFCNECPFRKADECMIDREITWQKNKEAQHGST